MTDTWHAHQPIELAAPVMALTASTDAVWAGGPGGVARFTMDEGWTPTLHGLTLRSVTALAQGAGSLIAGGDGGIARSLDGGNSWRRCAVPAGALTITALALSPRYDEDGTGLAAALGNGILRSTDGGQSWATSSFGLASSEVFALAWESGQSVFAATAAGLFRSPNGGRAWRIVPAAEGRAFVALAVDNEGHLFAAPEIGPPLRFTDDLGSWAPLGNLPHDIEVSALVSLSDGATLLGAANHGILISTDGGISWSRHAADSLLGFATHDAGVYAGTREGILRSLDGGETWRELPAPPVHDLRRLHIVGGAPLVSGCASPPVSLTSNGEWVVHPQTPSPLTGLFLAPDDTLWCSSPDGLFRSRDLGASWAPVLQGSEGSVARMTFGMKGSGWAGITAHGAVLHTGDGGSSWERLPSPFGVLPLIALQAVPNRAARTSNALIAVTYDERQQAAAVWRSEDDGHHWSRGVNIRTPWPVVATCGNPPLVTLGNVITVQRPDGDWRQVPIADTSLRRVVSDGAVMLALGTAALWRSHDLGATWERDESGLPVDQTLDIALEDGELFALLTAGRVWSRRL